MKQKIDIEKAREHLRKVFSDQNLTIHYSKCKSEWPTIGDFILACAILGLEINLK
jgi:hypothetical protein